MDMIIKTQLPKVLLLSATVFISACSTQSISIPGSQLFGQQKNDICVDKKTGKAIPGCKAQTTSKTKREPLRLLSDKSKEPVVSRKTVITADTAPAKKTADATTPTAQTQSNFGVTATKAKLPKTAVVAPVMTKPVAVKTAPVASKPKVTALPKPKPAVVQTETTRRLTLSGSTNFKTGSSKLNSAGKSKLASLARTLTSRNTKITRLLIEGHTDSVGAAAFNQVLSLKRANAVADYLASQGLIRSSMETVGQGESAPIADNKTKAGRAQNRRVEITATGTRQTSR